MVLLLTVDKIYHSFGGTNKHSGNFAVNFSHFSLYKHLLKALLKHKLCFMLKICVFSFAHYIKTLFWSSPSWRKWKTLKTTNLWWALRLEVGGKVMPSGDVVKELMIMLFAFTLDFTMFPCRKSVEVNNWLKSCS